MDGYNKKDENSLEEIKVKPHENELPVIDDSVMEVDMKPLSWNVIRLKKD